MSHAYESQYHQPRFFMEDIRAQFDVVWDRFHLHRALQSTYQLRLDYHLNRVAGLVVSDSLAHRLICQLIMDCFENHILGISNCPRTLGSRIGSHRSWTHSCYSYRSLYCSTGYPKINVAECAHVASWVATLFQDRVSRSYNEYETKFEVRGSVKSIPLDAVQVLQDASRCSNKRRTQLSSIPPNR